MARDHARFQTAIHNDTDWRKLDPLAQHAYWMIVTHPDLSYCGVIDYLPARWVGLSNGLTIQKIKASIRTLERARYVIVDRSTSELFVRSFIRHDNILARRNMGNACGRALGMVHSDPIREAVIHELARLYLEDSTREGWSGFQKFDPMAFDMACAMASGMACAMERST